MELPHLEIRMSRTFRRKSFSPAKESNFVGFEVWKRTDIDGNCSMTEEEQEKSIKKDFNRFHSDKWRFNSDGPIIRAAMRRYRKLERVRLAQSIRAANEDEFQIYPIQKVLSGWLW